MDTTRFETISKLFAGRRTRRQALAQVGASLAAAVGGPGLARQAVAQDAAATPATTSAEDEAPMFLFLQAFQSGSVVPKEGAEGRYVLTLEQGLGQTVYFSDRPDRIVGAAPTPKFLEGLGFPDDNPPNAALVVETEAGQTEVAVLELFAPAYDEATHTATYEVAVLAEWERQGETGGAVFSETTQSLAEQFPRFEAAHLFIDDCPDAAPLQCYKECGSDPVANLGTRGMCWSWADWTCHPCVGDWQGTAFECGFNFASCISGCFTDHWGVCGTL